MAFERLFPCLDTGISSEYISSKRGCLWCSFSPLLQCPMAVMENITNGYSENTLYSAFQGNHYNCVHMVNVWIMKIQAVCSLTVYCWINVPNVSKDCSKFIFRVKQSTKLSLFLDCMTSKMKSLWSFNTSETTDPKIGCNTQDDLKDQQRRCEKLRSLTVINIFKNCRWCYGNFTPA